MANEQQHLVVGEPLEAGSSVTTRGAGCGFADIQNPADRPLQVRGQFLAGCQAESSPTVFTVPFEMELPPQSMMSIGLGLTCTEEATVGLGPATGESSASGGGYIWRPIANDGQRRADLNAFLIMTGAQTVDPDRLRLASPQAVRIELPAGETVRIGLQLDGPAVAADPIAEAVADGLIDETQIREPTPEEESEEGDVEGLDWDRSNWRALDGGDTAGDDELDRDESPRRSHEREDGDGPGDTAGMEGAEPPGTGMMFAKGRLAVAADVGLNMRAVNEPVASAGIGLPDTWTAVEPGSATSVEVTPGVDVRFSWPDPLLPQLMSMPNIWYTATIPYEAPTSDASAPRVSRSSLSRPDDVPIAPGEYSVYHVGMGESAASPPARRSSAAGFDAGPYAATGSSNRRGRSVVPIGIAIIVIALLLAGAFVVFRGGDGSDPTPASEDSGAEQAGNQQAGNAQSGDTSSGAAAEEPSSGDSSADAVPGSDADSDFVSLVNFFTANGSPAQQAFATTYVDRRPDANAPPPEWVDGVSAFFFYDASGEVWVRIDAPAEVAADLCGEVDIITGTNQHAGSGIDYCAEGAVAPYYFEDVVTFEAPLDGEVITIVIRTGQFLVADNDRVSCWSTLASNPDNYQAAEFVGQAAFAQQVDATEVGDTTSGTVSAGARPE